MRCAAETGAIGSVRPAADPMASRPFRLVQRQRETHDTVTLVLEPLDGLPLRFAPGQFTMVGRVGVGEVPISISGDPADPLLHHTIRDVGGVTRVLAAAQVGQLLEVRGPYGTGWDLAAAAGGDVVVVAGGVGLAPLRGALLRLLAESDRYTSLTLLYGARTPRERLYVAELERWRDRGMVVETIVDRGGRDWDGRVGLVTTLVPRVGFDPARSTALLCGPEVMMRFVTRALRERGVPAERIQLSLERSMKCGVGLCGHCQLRELFVCVDGPVLDYRSVAPLLAIREV